MKRRALLVTTTLVAVSAVALTVVWRPVPLLLWNASASVPIGLYAVRPTGTLTNDELVVVAPPEPLATFLADGRYLPRGVPLIKRIAAGSGQRVCRRGSAISIDGSRVAIARHRDHAGSPLPIWSGCRTIIRGEVFLLNAHEPASLDGRYFGPLPSSSVIGRAVPLWTTDRR